MPEDRRPDPILKRELDRALQENQELRAAANRLQRPGTVLRRLGGIAVREGRRALPRARPASRPPGESFSPYRVRVPAPAPGSRPRVLHAIGNFYTGGSARLVVDLVEHLGARYQHLVLSRDVPVPAHYEGIELHARPRLGGARDAARVIARLRPDLVHVHFLGHHGNRYGTADWDWYEPLFAALERLDVPVIENVNIPVAPFLSPAVSRYVFVSDTVRAVFGPEGARSETIYPGSDVERFSRPADAQPPADCVGMVYRFEADKLDESVIEIFTATLAARPGTRALLVGGGRFLEPYRAAVARAGLSDAVTFTGYVGYDDLPDLYRQMTVFVAPPHTESFGHVVPLAMVLGLPVVAYAVGALPEILGSDELLVPPGDTEQMAARVVALLDDPAARARIGEANRRRAQERFSVTGMIADYARLYAELLPESAPAQSGGPDAVGGRP